jgi:hypothetical protein
MPLKRCVGFITQKFPHLAGKDRGLDEDHAA